MAQLQVESAPEVAAVFGRYPAEVRPKLEYLRQLVLKTAASLPALSKLEETLKWGEPSYLVKKGSTIRMDWKERAPDQYAMYFSCSTQLVPTFRTIFADQFEFEGNRAIVFQMGDDIPEAELEACIKAALQYHRIKHLPLLGM